MQYGPKTITDGLVFFTDGTQGYAGDDAIKTPEDIPNCCLWLDASDTSSFSLSGSNVTQWNDKSGNGNHATAYNSSNYPQYSSSYTVNGKNAINFIATANNAGQMLKGSFTTSGANQPGQNGGYTRFVVYKMHNFVGSEFNCPFEMAQGSFLSGSYGSRNLISTEGYAYNSQDRIRFYNNGTAIYVNLRAENNIVLMSEVLNSSTGYLQGFVNGYRWGNSSTTNYTFTDYVVGNDMTDGDFFNGYICEVIIFNRVLSDQERLQIDFYLARKWDLAFYSLATDQTYQRRLKDMGGDSSVSTGSWAYYNPGFMPGRGVLYQKDNGRRIQFTGSSAVQNLAGTGTSGELTIEWACACMSHLDNGTNYEIFNNESYQNNGIVIRHDGATWRPYVRFSHGGSPTYSNLYINTADVTYSGEWAHWMVWFSGSECKWYKNGTQIQNNTSFSAPATSSLTTGAPFGIGSQSFNGEIAFVKMYNRALTTTEIAQSYQYAQNRIDQIPKIPKPRDIQRFYDVDMFGRNAGTSGGYWYDLSYNNSYSNAATTGASVVGPTLASTTYWYPKYYSLDGTDDRFDITSYSFGNGNWSVSTWVNADSFNDVTIMSNSSGGPVTNAFGFDYGPNATWNIAYWNYGYANNGAGPGGSWYNNFGNSSLSTKKWYMLTWVNYSNYTMKMYVNGVADSSTFYSFTTNGGPCDRIGTNYGANYFDGKIANFMIWDVALTDAEVLQNFNFYKNRFGY